MTTRRAPAAGVFGPYDAERAVLAAAAGEVVWCTRCPQFGRRTALVQKLDAIGRTTERCPACDGVAPPRPAHPDEVFKPQALIGKAQLLPPCPAGVLRCQHCAKPVAGNDDRFCLECQNPGLSRKEIAQLHRAREDREAAAAPARPKPELPRALYPHGATLAAPRALKIVSAKPEALARAVNREVRGQGRSTPSIAPKAARMRTCLKCGAQSPHTGGPREIKDCRICTPRVKAPPRLTYRPKVCACGCGETFQPTGGRSIYIEGHR